MSVVIIDKILPRYQDGSYIKYQTKQLHTHSYTYTHNCWWLVLGWLTTKVLPSAPMNSLYELNMSVTFCRDTRSEMETRNPRTKIPDSRTKIQDPRTKIRDPRWKPEIQERKPEIRERKSENRDWTRSGRRTADPTRSFLSLEGQFL